MVPIQVDYLACVLTQARIGGGPGSIRLAPYARPPVVPSISSFVINPREKASGRQVELVCGLPRAIVTMGSSALMATGSTASGAEGGRSN